MTSPRPGERTAEYYDLPTPGDYVRVKGLVSTTYLRRGETMVIRWSDWWTELVTRNYVDLVARVEEPAASEYFPTMDVVWDLIETGARTLPGEKILGLQATSSQIIARVGTEEAYSRTYAVDWPEMDLLFREITNLRDHTQELSGNATRALSEGTEELRTLLVDYNGIASAAAEISLSAAERAEEAGGEAGLSAFEIAVKYGYTGSEEQWLSSLRGPQGEAGPQGPQGEPGEDGKSIAVTGTVATAADLPSSGTVGEGWVTEDDGHLHVWGGAAWAEVGPVRGPEGPQGPAGADGVDGTSFLIQGTVASTTDLPVGAEVGVAYELADGTAVQMHPDGWGNPVPFRGPEGPVGPPGATGPRGLVGEAGTDGVDGASFLVRGSVGSEAELPSDAVLGDAYVLGNGTAVQWLGESWSEPVQFEGPQGERGEVGPQGERGPQGLTGERGPRGPEGPVGALTEGQKIALFGSASFDQKPMGVLGWSGPSYIPMDGFHRLRYAGNGRLRVVRDYGGVAVESAISDRPHLYAPVDGMYLVSARQTWDSGDGTKGVGLGRSVTDGATDMVSWQDADKFTWVETTTVTFLTAGTRLYPWVWSWGSGQLLPSQRGMESYFALVYLGGI